VVDAHAESNGTYRLRARHFHNEGERLSTRVLTASGFIKAMKALHLADAQISAIRKSLETTDKTEIGGIGGAQRVFNAPILVAAGFESAAAE
jgi:ribosomal protein S13